jgi:DNA helicase-2/ATP-dependent DNA helicase PcrA
MENSEGSWIFEQARLKEAVGIAKMRLEKAIRDNEGNALQIASMESELRESAPGFASNLYSSQNFEDLIELAQMANPISQKIAEAENIGTRIAVLKRQAKSPYFARIDFLFDGEGEGEMIYVGRASLEDGNSDILVYDWRSPIASLYYRFGVGRAFYEAPMGKMQGEILLKRQYEIKDGKLEFFFDADVQIVDEFLRKILSQNASPQMKSIVETIQKEQDAAIRDTSSDLVMVQGVAGSGKTSVALHRAAYLMYQGMSSSLKANNILILSPNSLFERYISNVLPELGEENADTAVLDDILAEALPLRDVQGRSECMEEMMAQGGKAEQLQKSLAFKSSPAFRAILDALASEMPERWVKYSDALFAGERIATKKEIRDRLLSTRADIPLWMRLEQAADFIIERAEDKNRAKKNRAEMARIANEAGSCMRFSVEGAYRRLFEDEKLFSRLSSGIKLPDCAKEALDYTRARAFSSEIAYDDAAPLAYLSLKSARPTARWQNIRQVVIDEAQDYYPLHYEIFALLFAGAKYTVLGDVRQTVEKEESLSLYEGIQKILKKRNPSLITLDKGFRSSRQILSFASRFLAEGDAPQSFSREGKEPETHAALGFGALVQAVASEVLSCEREGFSSIGLLCKSEKNARELYSALKGLLGERLVLGAAGREMGGATLLPIYMSKGLEFDCAIVCDADSANYDGEAGQRLLYIASTRALHRLAFYAAGEVSPLLKPGSGLPLPHAGD